MSDSDVYDEDTGFHFDPTVEDSDMYDEDTGFHFDPTLEDSDVYDEDTGFHFDPTLEELTIHYLIPKMNGEDCGDFIVMKDIYAKEPWLLDHTSDSFFMEDEWYYFVTRTEKSDKQNGYGKNVNRRITGDCGYWKANGKEEFVINTKPEEIGTKKWEITLIKQNLTYTRSHNKNNKRKRGDKDSDTVPGSKASWIMDEYTIQDKDNKFQKLALCKIHKIKDKDNQD